MNKNLIKTISLISLLLFTNNVLAIDMEYITDNGFTEIYNAFDSLALIFSNSSFKGLIFIVAFGSILIAGFTNYFGKPLISGGTPSLVGWLGPTFTGLIFYIVFFVTTGTLHIYDPVKNRYQAVEGIPSAIVILFGVTNTIEQGVSKIINSSSSANTTLNSVDYQMILDASLENIGETGNYYLEQNIQQYYKKCGTFAINTQGSSINQEQLKSGSEISIVDSFESWRSPNIYAYMFDQQGNKTLVSCETAYDDYLTKDLNNTSFFTNIIEKKCQKYGFKVENSQQKSACFNIYDKAWQLHGLNANKGAELYFRDILVAKNILNAISDSDPIKAQTMLAKKQLMVQSIGIMNVARDLSPNLLSVMVAVFIGLIPILTLSLVSPLFGASLKFICGGVLWLTTWGLTIAVTNSGAISQALSVFAEVQQHKLGLEGFLTAQTAAIESLGIFGRMQAMSAMLASAISFGVYRFGAYAMANMADMQASNLQELGARSAEQTMTPQGRQDLADSTTVASASALQTQNIGGGDYGYGLGSQLAGGSNPYYNASSALFGDNAQKGIEQIQEQGHFSMAGSEILQNSQMMGHLDDSQKAMLNNNQDEIFQVDPTLNEQGGFTNLDITQGSAISDSSTTSQHFGNTNTVSSQDLETNILNGFDGSDSGKWNNWFNTDEGNKDAIQAGQKVSNEIVQTQDIEDFRRFAQSQASAGGNIPFTKFGASMTAGGGWSWNDVSTTDVNRAMMQYFADEAGGNFGKFTESTSKYNEELKEYAANQSLETKTNVEENKSEIKPNVAGDKSHLKDR